MDRVAPYFELKYRSKTGVPFLEDGLWLDIPPDDVEPPSTVLPAVGEEFEPESVTVSGGLVVAKLRALGATKRDWELHTDARSRSAIIKVLVAIRAFEMDIMELLEQPDADTQARLIAELERASKLLTGPIGRAASTKSFAKSAPRVRAVEEAKRLHSKLRPILKAKKKAIKAAKGAFRSKSTIAAAALDVFNALPSGTYTLLEVEEVRLLLERTTPHEVSAMMCSHVTGASKEEIRRDGARRRAANRDAG